MTTPYCSKDQWAHRHGYADWAAFVADGQTYPDPEQMDDVLEDATDIMNDSEHINCLSTNISDTDYTQRLERINFNMSNRMLDAMNGRGEAQFSKGIQNWSQADYLMTFERAFLIQLGLRKGHRLAGNVS